MKIQFLYPKKKKILVYLSNINNRKDILSEILCDLDYAFFYSARTIFIIRPIPIFFGFLSRFFSKSKSFNNGYLYGLIKVLNPQILLTLIDNSIFFQYLDYKFHKKIKIYTIQNATRGQLLERDLGKNFNVFHSNLFCWGESEKVFYEAYGAKVLNYHYIGSLRDSLYRKKFPDYKNYNKIYDIYIPSNYRKNPHYYSKLKILMDYISRVALEYDLSVVVGLRLSKDDIRQEKYIEEKNFYLNHLCCKFKLIDNNQLEFSNYMLSDKSKVSIGFNTAILKEAFGRNNKILSCNFTKYKYYDFPIKGFWTSSEENYNNFKKTFKKIYDMDNTMYLNQTKSYSKSIIAFDENNPTEKYLYKLLKSNYE